MKDLEKKFKGRRRLTCSIRHTWSPLCATRGTSTGECQIMTTGCLIGKNGGKHSSQQGIKFQIWTSWQRLKGQA